MKHVVQAIVLGAVLSGSVNAVEQSTAGQPALSKDLTNKATPQVVKKVVKKTKQLRSKKMKSADRLAGKAADSRAKGKLDKMTETPPESIDESVQIKGVRG